MIELSRHVLTEANELARKMLAEGVTYAPLPSTPSMCVSTDVSQVIYLDSIEVEGAEYFIGLTRPSDNNELP